MTILVLGAVMAMDQPASVMPIGDRLEFALRADLFIAIWLAAAIANVARLRFFSERDIAGSSVAAGSETIRMAGAILQNTVEQAVLALLAHLIVAATLPGSNALIVALVGLFGLGRLLFWAGYRHGASGRAFGFALTFYPSVLALLASAVAIAFGWAA
ncbi:MAPEG family protein [Sphingomonas solaris]|uniref:MAPEG family protein n=1 Tax=Alterirhizorhabdus solaris TaxID=2529389 RepID=UPI001EEFE33A|nr:MAPEG family protein [Sphingomonas solaris]